MPGRTSPFTLVMEDGEEVPEITAEDLFEVVSTNPAVVIHFDAPWNSPSSETRRHLKVIRDQCCPKVHLVSMNIDDPKNWDLATKLKIVSVPVFSVHVDGELTGILRGFQAPPSLRQLLQQAEATIPWYWQPQAG